MHGKVPRKAKTAIRYVCDGSASPMETCLALLLGLPARYGGYGLGMPEMNAKVLIPARLGKRTTYRKYHCDLYWSEQNVAIAHSAASLMGKRIRIAYVDIDERRMSLRKQLFSKDPWC